MSPWKHKRTRQKAWVAQRSAARHRYGLVTADEAIAASTDFHAAGVLAGRLDSANRLRQLVDGLSGTFLGPYGQVEIEAYQRAIRVVEAVRYTPPRELLRREVARRMG